MKPVAETSEAVLQRLQHKAVRVIDCDRRAKSWCVFLFGRQEMKKFTLARKASLAEQVMPYYALHVATILEQSPWIFHIICLKCLDLHFTNGQVQSNRSGSRFRATLWPECKRANESGKIVNRKQRWRDVLTHWLQRTCCTELIKWMDGKCNTHCLCVFTLSQTNLDFTK